MFRNIPVYKPKTKAAHERAREEGRVAFESGKPYANPYERSDMRSAFAVGYSAAKQKAKKETKARGET